MGKLAGDDVVDAIDQGDSLDLGWKSLDNGAEYRGKIFRWGPSTFGLRVESRGAGPLGGQQWLSLLVNYESSFGIGRCCDAAALVDGVVHMEESEDSIIGQDAHPAGWEDAGVCTNGLEDGPGLIIKDVDDLDLEDGTVDGVPAIVEDPTIADSTFSNFGDKTWEDLKNRGLRSRSASGGNVRASVHASALLRRRRLHVQQPARKASDPHRRQSGGDRLISS